MNFADRCAIAAGCLPKADYRAKLESLHAEMLAALEAAQRDAVRWQWLAPRLLAADFDYNGEGSNALVFEMPDHFVASADASETIDAAMKGDA